MSELARVGVVYGRFQPFHKGHLEYTRAALDRSETLVIGITNADATQTTFERTDPERHLPRANPFTFFERYAMIKRALHDDGVPLERINIVPFPVHDRERWCDYVPQEATHFRVLLSAWDAEKVRRLRESGLKVDVLDFPQKAISASLVRTRIAAGEDWRDLVPSGTAALIDEVGGVERIKRLYSGAPSQTKAVAFDLRNTVLKVDQAYERCEDWLFEFVQHRRPDITREEFTARLRTADKVRFENAHNFTVHNWTRLILAELVRALGLGLSAEDFERVLARYESIFVDHVELFPRVVGLLRHLRERGLLLALVIDGTVARETRIIDRLGLRASIDVIVISEEVGLNKFTSAPLEAALVRLGVRPDEIIVVGDRIDKDITNANKLGMRSALLRSGAPLRRNTKGDANTPDFEIGALDELASVIDA